MTRNRLLAIIALSILASLPGCRRFTTGESTTVETPAPDGGNATVTQQGPRIDATTATTDDQKAKAQANEPGVTLPIDFPKDVPVPVGAKPTSVTTVGPMTMVSLESTAPADDVLDFYKKSLPVNGWQIEATAAGKLGSSIGATKQKRTLNVMVGKGEEKTTIRLTVGTVVGTQP